MDDIQSMQDARDVSLERVGVKKLSLPIMVLERDGSFQHVASQASLMVDVDANARAAHLSRFVELLTEWADKPVSSRELQQLLRKTMDRAGSASAEVAVSFKYFLLRSAPVSQIRGFLDFDCEFRAWLDAEGFNFTLGVAVPVATVCPCSKAISDAGAHNQRSVVSVRIRYEAESFVWIEDLVSLVERQGSCPVFPVLKRVDEKHVTELAYDNPKFVEDVVRDVVVALNQVPNVSWCSVQCESYESIHNHNAFASAERLFDREGPTRQELTVAMSGADGG